MPNIDEIMKMAQDAQNKLMEAQQKLDTIEVEGAAGGGMVVVALNGKGEMRRLKVEPSLLKPEEAEVMEDLVVAAHNDAKARLDAKLAEEMGKLTGGMSLPAGFKLPFS